MLKALIILLGLAPALLGSVLAVCGAMQAFPPPPRGDEHRHALRVAATALDAMARPWVEPEDEPRPLVLGFAGATLPAMAASGVLALFLWRRRGVMRGRAAVKRGGHLVLAGAGGLNLLLLRRALTRDCPAAAILSPEQSPVFRPDSGDWPILPPVRDPVQALIRAGSDKAAMIALSGADDGETLRWLDALLATLSREPRRKDPARLLLTLEDPLLRRQIEARLGSLPPRSLIWQTQSRAALAARRLFLAQPFDLFSWRDEASSSHAVILGFGKLGQEILLQHLRLAHDGGAARPRATILDRNAARLGEIWRETYPMAPCFADVRFLPVDFHGVTRPAEVWRALFSETPRPTALYLCFSDPIAALPIASALEQLLTRELLIAPPIHVFDADGSVAAGLRLAGTLDARPTGMVRCFTQADDALDDDLVLRDEAETLARSLHETYLRNALAQGARLGERPSLAEWADLPESLRDDNRASADHDLMKLRIAGLTVTDHAEAVKLAPALAERLAEAEHQRWCAARWLAGWRWGERRDDEARLHPDLVPYQALDTSRKALDHAVIDTLAARFAKCGKGIAAVQDFSASDGAEGLVERLGARRVRLNFAAPAERRLGLRVLKEGAKLTLTLDGPTHLILGDLTPEDREEAITLLRLADRIYAAADERPA